MKLIKRSTKPRRNRYAGLLHIVFVSLLPIVMYVLVRLDFTWIAVLVLLLGKWRMFAIKPRHWPANIRANAVDLLAGLSVLIFMISTDVQIIQAMWAALYAVWLLVIKPLSSPLWVGLQALISQSLALSAVFLFWVEASVTLLVFLVWGVAYFTARHFLSAFDESMARATAYVWAFFAASLTWATAHWTIYYGPIAQPALVLSVIGYGMAAMYYLEHKDKLTVLLRRQFVAVMAIVILFLIIFSDWSDITI
jgi:hypothetical protein